ncbi:hypothetical protein [Hyphomicrobium sp. MC1]|uniref:hypothetical protein n=1 Tax=Hyphomicrobium sp. (strain MC1) TaxID=717785 RepID=UPI000213DAAF|nr:hypothetical protein [Hyphomicrobium sp. MC1]CCB64468.1 protein of unknown function [Hyphomicrobium sp. MC1]
MDYEEMKLECLRLAVGSGAKGDEAVTLATKFYEHCRGRNQNDLVGGGKARVVGKNGNVPDALKDYKPE